MFLYSVSIRPEINNFDPKAKSSLNEFQEKIALGRQREKNQSNNVLVVKFNNCCITNAHTPKPLYAIKMPIHPEKNAAIKDSSGWSI